MVEDIKSTAEAVKGIVEAVPIYEDLLQPTIRELGKGLHTLSKTVHIALSPVSALVWGYDRIKVYVQSSLEQKLAKVPRENIIPPDLTVAGPALEALRFTGHKEELREMFSNLLATAMDSSTAPKAHPSFVEIIKQISPDEAKIISMLYNNVSVPIIKVRAYDKDRDHYAEPLQNFSLLPYTAKCEFPILGPSYIENIVRLGLVDHSYVSYNTFPNAYDPLEKHPIIVELVNSIKPLDKRVEIIKGTITRNAFGQKFYEACVSPK